ncbi:ankyrin repeat-containing domain protein, partial [Phaeosphaeriaceae sp. PMI808]
TPLHYAAGRGMSETVKLLIATGADVFAKDYRGNTPLHLAAITDSYQVLDLLVEAGADVHSEARFGWAAIDQASISQHYNTVQRLMDLSSRPPTWEKSAMNEFVRLSPCPVECYGLQVTFET